MKCALAIGSKGYVAWNAKCCMTSLADTKNIYSWKDLWCIEFCSWLSPRAVSRLRARFARDEIIKSLRSRNYTCIHSMSLYLYFALSISGFATSVIWHKWFALTQVPYMRSLLKSWIVWKQLNRMRLSTLIWHAQKMCAVTIVGTFLKLNLRSWGRKSPSNRPSCKFQDAA